MTLIRATTVADISRLPAIERSAGEAFRQYPQWSWIADDAVMSVEEHARLVALQTCWVAQRESEQADDAGSSLCGFLCAEAFVETMDGTPDGAKTLHVWELAVRDSAQGLGLGTALMRRAMTEAVNQGYSSLTLTTFRDVVFNAPFYARLGFDLLEEDATAERFRLDLRLRQILEAEAVHGLPIESRCAMRFVINR